MHEFPLKYGKFLGHSQTPVVALYTLFCGQVWHSSKVTLKNWPEGQGKQWVPLETGWAEGHFTQDEDDWL